MNTKWVYIRCDASFEVGAGSIFFDSRALTTLDSLYEACSIAFKFPNFGKNYNALFDVLTDLDWRGRQSFEIYLLNANFLLCEEADDALDGLLHVMNRAGGEWSKGIHCGEAWDRPSVPFSTILHDFPSISSRIRRSVESLGVEAEGHS